MSKQEEGLQWVVDQLQSKGMKVKYHRFPGALLEDKLGFSVRITNFIPGDQYCQVCGGRGHDALECTTGKKKHDERGADKEAVGKTSAAEA